MDEKTQAVTGNVGSALPSKDAAVKGDTKPAPGPAQGPTPTQGAASSSVIPTRTTQSTVSPATDIAKTNAAKAGAIETDATKANVSKDAAVGKDKSLSQRIADKQIARNQEKTDLLKRISDIEEEYLHNISDIPRDHEYWDLLNAYRRKP